jgi:hypothetical protein
LIYVEERDLVAEKIIRVPFDPNEVFEDITFDPRLLTFEKDERETVIQSLGYKGSISKSDLYQRILLEVDPLPVVAEAAEGAQKREHDERKC